MAKTKKKIEEEIEEDEVDSSKLPLEQQLEILEAQLKKQYGLGTFVDASSVVDSETEILHTTPSLDLALGGGAPEGSWITLSGPSKSGKTTLALTMAAAAQKQGRLVVYVDIEGRVKKKNLMGIAGLDLSPDKFRLIRSTQEQILSGTDFLDQASAVIEGIPRCFLIMDSFSSLSEAKERSDGVTAETRGGIQKNIARFTRILSQVVCVNKSFLVGITHIIANTGWGGGDVEKIPNALKYQRDISLVIKKTSPWVINEKRGLTDTRQIGLQVTWQIKESSLGSPGSEAICWLRYGHGYDSEVEIYELAKAMKFISKTEKGGWVTFDFLDLEKPIKIQGDEKAFNKLKSDPVAWKLLNNKVMGYLTGEEPDES